MADIICRWRNGTTKTVVELVNSMPHSVMPADRFRTIMQSSIWGPEFFRTPYQLACQLGLYCEAEDGYFYPRFDHDINEDEAKSYLELWITRYYVPNPYTGRDGFNNIECPTYVLFELYRYTRTHPNCTYKEAYKAIFKEDATNNNDIVKNYINNFSKVLVFDNNGFLNITNENPQSVFDFMERNDKKGFFDSFERKTTTKIRENLAIEKNYLPYLTALRTKPFMLLAGISGTGKSRIVRKLAQATTTQTYANENDRWNDNRPENFELIQVKPNWHNSMDVVGFYSNISRRYEFTPFIEFIVKAWQHKDTPYFLCLDEMNLAPVEEYFAEFLSAIESRSTDADGNYITDPIIKPFKDFGEKVGKDMLKQLFGEADPIDKNPLAVQFYEKGLTLPPNLMVMGTVNMDETTFTFSRKVLDRAMSIEMNEVDYDKFLSGETEAFPLLTDFNALLVNRPQKASEVKDDIDSAKVVEYLKDVNALLEDTPFKLGYRAANEAMLYVSANKELAGEKFSLTTALDGFTLMKILSRIEGDDQRLSIDENDPRIAASHITADTDGDPLNLLTCLRAIVRNHLGNDTQTEKKIASMCRTLEREHFVSYWG